MKTTFAAAFTVLSALAFGVTQTANATTLTVWTKSPLNLREAPTTHADKLLTLPKHKKIELVECKYDSYGSAKWCKTHIGHSWGWVSANYLTTKKPVKDVVKPTLKITPPYSYQSSYSSY